MGVDWVATLQVQADLVMKVSDDVAREFETSERSMEQASRLYRMVEPSAQDFDGILELMSQHELDDSLRAAAETIEDAWTNLSVATANKLKAMRGPDPIDIPPDDDGKE